MEDILRVEEIFGENVFDDRTMKKYLSRKTYDNFNKVIREGLELDRKTADEIAAAMKKWAIEKGATHFTHWFQPLTGFTAEKQDAFISGLQDDGSVILEFDGKALIKGEPDASSFPSGGLRATFEARGYTSWDCSSPAFVRSDASGKVLCIPTIFCSYTGDALDQKTPLLRSMDVINKESIRLLRLIGNKTSKSVTPYVGAEQEYFLVDRNIYKKRKDLVYTGRTLFGVMPPKGQELDDHYYGSIKERIGAFMKEVDIELWRLGIPSKTRHNEVAPAQHELAPIYTKCNIAVDHNQIIMRVLKMVAGRHGLKCLLNEKPFAGVNGSGKHNNWSLVTDDGINLINPGKKPHENTRFLLILSLILKAVDEHADLLRESAANIGNDIRLGSDEAPPSIISVFVGEELEDIINQIIENKIATHSKKKEKIDMGINFLSNVSKDVADRNRTSPFAFTGNKFEFRMVGSRDSIASPNIVLNSIVAKSFSEASDILEKSDDIKSTVLDIIYNNFRNHKRILFSGNGYSKNWEVEAKKRGLTNINNMLDAVESLEKEENIELFEKLGVLTKSELLSRAEIQRETYSKLTNIEAKVMIDVAGKHIIPSIIKYSYELSRTINNLEKSSIDSRVPRELLQSVTNYLEKTKDAWDELKKLLDEANSFNIEDKKTAFYYRDDIRPAMKKLREPIDELEMIVDKSVWPMPSYGDLLFDI